MPRRKDERSFRRFKLRISLDLEEVCDRYSIEQINQIFDCALRNFTPEKNLGVRQKHLIRPEKIRTKIVARISNTGRTVQILFPEKREDFREIMRQFEYEWAAPYWQKTVEEEKLCDRMSELAHNLLLNEFAIQVEYSGVAEFAMSGGYEPEAFRLVKVCTKNPYEGWFTFEYPRGERHWYEEIMAISGAKYIDGLIRVPPECFAEVEDFSEQNDFSFSLKAKEALEKARLEWSTGQMFMPSVKEKKKQGAENPIDSNEVVIPDALKDDDT